MVVSLHVRVCVCVSSHTSQDVQYVGLVCKMRPPWQTNKYYVMHHHYSTENLDVNGSKDNK